MALFNDGLKMITKKKKVKYFQCFVFYFERHNWEFLNAKSREGGAGTKVGRG